MGFRGNNIVIPSFGQYLHKKTAPIDFQGQGSKIKVTRFTLLNIVNTI